MKILVDMNLSPSWAAELRSKGRAPSVVQMRTGDVSPESMLGQIVNALRQSEADLAQGALVTIEPARHRIRLLPLSPK